MHVYVMKAILYRGCIWLGLWGASVSIKSKKDFLHVGHAGATGGGTHTRMQCRHIFTKIG